MDPAISTVTQEDERDLVDVLLDAHVRGRLLLESALRMLESETDELIVIDVASAVHRFLTFTNPQHELDEEQMIFPALRAAGHPADVEPALAHMVEAHMVFDARRDELARRWEQVVKDPGCLRKERDDLFSATERLAHALEHHRHHEDVDIFPLIRKYVPAETQARIVAVLSRRDARP
jgi:hemerythrin-like domain-containing protein